MKSSNDADGSTIPVDIPPAEGEVFARAHSGSEGYSKKARLWGMRCSPEKRSSLLCRQHRHFSALLTRKFNSQRGIIEEQPEILGISDRHMRRWRERYVEEGYNGLLDRRRGKPSRRRVPVATVEKVFALYREKYFDLNVQHFHEKLQAEHGIELSYTWVKQALQGAGLVARGRKRGAHRKRRERRPLPGMLLHIDGSRHQWFQDERWYDLIVILDDASSEIYYAQLVEEESTTTVMAGLKEVIERKGVFCALYSDRGSHFWLTPKAGGKIDPHRLTQVGRALRELGVQMIPAYSPQARGRSERTFGTWQGRLPQELPLRGARTLETANRFLREHYIDEFNARFRVPA